MWLSYNKPRYLLFFILENFYLAVSFCLVVNCNGRSGWLAIFWKNDVQFEVLEFLNMVIHGCFSVGPSNPSKWFFTEVYGSLDLMGHMEFWPLLRSLNLGRNLLWLVGGDFNKILTQ